MSNETIMQFRPTVRRAAFLRVLIIAESKDGKSYTANALSHHLAKLLGLPPEKIGAIDAESIGGGENAVSRYELNTGERCNCATCNRNGVTFDGHQVLMLGESKRSPDGYVEAIGAAAAAGVLILVIDGITPEWSWCLAEVDKGKNPNENARWAPVRPKHDKFRMAVEQFPGHVIATCRGKEKTKPQSGGAPLQLGFQPIQSPQVEFDFDACLRMDKAHAVCASRADMLNGRTWDRPGHELATSLLAWSRLGETAVRERAKAREEVVKLIDTLPEKEAAAAREWLEKNKGDPGAALALAKRIRAREAEKMRTGEGAPAAPAKPEEKAPEPAKPDPTPSSAPTGSPSPAGSTAAPMPAPAPTTTPAPAASQAPAPAAPTTAVTPASRSEAPPPSSAAAMAAAATGSTPKAPLKFKPTATAGGAK